NAKVRPEIKIRWKPRTTRGPHQPLASPSRYEHAPNYAAGGEHQTFSEHLPDYASTARTQCASHGIFMLASHCLRKEQIRYIGTRDEQHHSDHARKQDH